MIQRRPSQETRLVVRIGVTGQKLEPEASNTLLVERSQEVLDKLQQCARDLHSCCKDLYANEGPTLRIISPLREGAELIVTREAIRKNFQLQCLLPVNQIGSYELFDDLWGSDSLRVELDNSLDSAPAVCEAVGQAVLRQCDVLIAVWNGEQEEKGEPGAIVQEALSRNVPIIWISPSADHESCLWERGLNPGEPPRKTDLNGLLDRLKPIFDLPKDVSSEPLKRFLAEKQPRPIALYKKFRSSIAYGWEKHAEKVDGGNWNDTAEAKEDCWAHLEEPNNLIGKKLLSGCQPHLERADHLANTYGDIYRSLFIATYMLGAAAVTSAFFGIYVEDLHIAFWIELGLITAILGLVGLGNHYHLHERWIDYRLLAEGFRQMQYLIPLARVTPAFEVPAYLEEDPGRTWFNWYFRAIARELGMISIRMDTAFLNTYQKVLADAVKEQIDYHSKTSAMMKLAHHRLHFLVVKCLFPATLVACLLHLIPEEKVGHLGRLFSTIAVLLLSLCAVVLPAVGAAVEGISHQGEFERISRRSKALRERLSALLATLSSPGRTMGSKDLGAQAEYFCQIQLLEQADWRAAFVTKPLTPP